MTDVVDEIASLWEKGGAPDAAILFRLATKSAVSDLTAAAEDLTRRGIGRRVSYSRKVFIPLTQLCRDVCGYCTFAIAPRPGKRAFLSIEEALTIAQTGAAAGCQEALFTLGEKPELRYEAARQELERLGCASTIDYLGRSANAVLSETGLLPHLNPGVLTSAQLQRLKPAAASMGLMLEATSPRLMLHGAAHWRAPDKDPRVRLQTLRDAGELGIPYTTGILIGIGESRLERLELLLAIRELHERYGHIQEVIVQKFRAKPGTRMARSPEPETDDML